MSFGRYGLNFIQTSDMIQGYTNTENGRLYGRSPVTRNTKNV